MKSIGYNLCLKKRPELLCRKAFQSELQGCCPRELVRLSLDIVRRCEGLPLALVAISGLLSTEEKIPLEWQKLHNSLSSELESNPHLTSITKILSLSYHDLPYYLKSCFLYFGIFPEDYSITDSRLFQLWIAEGYIKGKKGKTLEEVAEENLIELIHRNLVQVSLGENDYKADDLSFIGKSRCLSIHGGRENVLETIEYSQDLQTLTLVEANHQEVGLIKELGKLRQLRMLGISNMTAGNGRALCASIKNMDHLKLLLVSSISEDEILDLQSLSSQPQYLEQLIIRGQLEKVNGRSTEMQPGFA
ncbi:disease resistance protein RPM1-like [Fagus crenata]